jgi:hypothetical protein
MLCKLQSSLLGLQKQRVHGRSDTGYAWEGEVQRASGSNICLVNGRVMKFSGGIMTQSHGGAVGDCIPKVAAVEPLEYSDY